MTQKELLYVEDATQHEKNIIKILNDSKERITDEELKTFLDNEINIHDDLNHKLMNLLESEVNE